MNKHLLVVHEHVTRVWHVIVEGATDNKQVRKWWHYGNISIDEGDNCELVEEESETKVISVYNLPEDDSPPFEETTD